MNLLRQVVKYCIKITVLAFLFSFCSCAGIKSTQLDIVNEKSNCNQQNEYSYNENDLPRPYHELDVDSNLKSAFSFKSLNVAHAIGIMEMLSEYVSLKQQTFDETDLRAKINMIELSQSINQRINIASLEISAVASEMDCEEERADQIASYLQAKEDDAETNLTVAAIIVGAAGAVTAGVLSDGNTAELIGIGTGIAEACLGLMILLNKRKIEFHHSRNALQDIWEGKKTSHIFSAPIWYYLNYSNPDVADMPSLRDQIINRWMSFGQIADASGKKKDKLIAMYFGAGGKYTAEQLYNRANMHDQIEASINLMKQDLKGLAKELEHFGDNTQY